MNKIVKQKFQSYPRNVKLVMMKLRDLIFDVANNTNGVGELEETLKWGEPSYLTSKTKSGTTIRIDWKPKYNNQIAMFVNCQTTIIENFKALFPEEFEYDGTRAILFPVDKKLPVKELTIFISMALRYHLDKNK